MTLTHGNQKNTNSTANINGVKSIEIKNGFNGTITLADNLLVTSGFSFDGSATSTLTTTTGKTLTLGQPVYVNAGLVLA